MRRTGSVRRWLVVAASALALAAGGVTPTAAAPVAVGAEQAVERYVTQVYSDLFGRAPDPEGLSTWRGAILSGRPRGEVANAITSSVEYRSRLVSGAYARFLGRGPDAQGLQFWLAAMANGWTVSRIGAGFVASDEYYAQAGSTPAGWVTRLYADVLRRGAAPSEVAFWEREIARGASRSQVALGFLLSTEHLSTVVDGYYVQLLDRHLDPTGQQTWVSALQSGVRDEDIIGGIISSQEYWTKAVGPTPTRIALASRPPVTAGVPFTLQVTAFDDVLAVTLGDVSAEAKVTIDGSAASCVAATCTITAAGYHTVAVTWRGITISDWVQVAPGPAAALVLTPPTASIADGASVVFSVAGRDAYGNSTGDVTASTAFAVDADPAACVAARCRPVGAGAHQVTATVTGAAGVTASATIHVAAPGPTRFRAIEWGKHSNSGPGGPDGAVLGSTAQWTSVSASWTHSLAIKSDGTLWAWGSDRLGQLGTGTWTDLDVPEQVGSRNDWTSVAAGDEFSLAVAADGTLWSWGWAFQQGVAQRTPKRVGTDTDWASVSAGGFALALKTDGSLWSWGGDNQFGQLGDGTESMTPRTAPARVGTGTWTTVAAGYYQGVGIASDGSLWTWGLKNLGWWTGTEQITELTPTRVGTASDWRAVGAGYRVAGAIRSDGSLWTFGDFVEEGQLGDGTTDIRLDPTQVGVGTTWSSVAFGFEHTVALDSSGGLWRWGKSEVEKADPVLVPQRVGTETGWASVGAGSSYTVALRP